MSYDIKKCKTGTSGQIIVNHLWCKDCDEYHPQFKNPCPNFKCRQGKVANPIETEDPTASVWKQSICPTCEGNTYV